MRKRNIALFVVLIVFLVIFAGAAFLFYTTPGTSLVLKGVGHFLPGFHMDKYSGTLGTSLRIDGLSLKSGDTTVNAASTYLKWRPARIFFGQLVIDDLQVRDITITQGKKPEEKPVDLTLPRLPRLATMLYGWIYSIRVDNLTIQSPDSQPIDVSHFAGSVLLNHGTIYLNVVSAKTSLGNIGGQIVMNLPRPGIAARLEAKPLENLESIDTILLDANLPAAQGKVQIAGPVNIRLISGKKDRLKIASRIGIEKQKVHITDIKITKAAGGTVDGKGAIDLSGKKAVFHVTATLTGLDLGPELPIHTRLSGTIGATGSADNFTGQFDIVNEGEAWKDVSLSANVRGVGDNIRFDDVNAAIYGGTIAGWAEIDRGPDMAAVVRLTGKDIDPARIREGLEGNLNFEIDGRIEMPQDAPVEGYVKAVMRESQFQQKNVSADIDASFENEIINIRKLNARGAGFAVNAHGIVQERLAFTARIDDASQLFPEAKGDILAEGWAKWRDDEISGVLSARGHNIMASSVRVSSFNADIRMPGGLDGAISADITGKDLSYGVFRSERMNLSLKGKMADHRISFLTLYKEFRVEALANGKYADGTWEGTIQKIAGREKAYGNWHLTRPSNVRISADEVSLSPFVITSATGENLALNARLSFDPLTGFVDARWSGV
ncbi:MAG: hypothetical protein ABFD12_03555, partial [Syntrophorhabdus sp.]